jgi:hypothetical protein
MPNGAENTVVSQWAAALQSWSVQQYLAHFGFPSSSCWQVNPGAQKSCAQLWQSVAVLGGPQH